MSSLTSQQCPVSSGNSHQLRPRLRDGIILVRVDADEGGRGIFPGPEVVLAPRSSIMSTISAVVEKKESVLPLAIPVATPLALIEALVPLTPLTPLEFESTVLDTPLPTPLFLSKAFPRSACRRSSSSLANRSSSSRCRASSASRSRASASRRLAASRSRIWFLKTSSS